MSNYHIVSPPNVVPGPVTQTYSAIPSGAFLGMEALALDRNAATSVGAAGGVFQFVRGAATSVSCPAGNFCHIIDGSAVVLAAARSASNFPVACLPAALSNTNVYGWAQVQGRVDYASHTNTGVTVGIPQYICAGTVGIVLSNSVAGNRIQGLAVPQTQTATGTAVSYSYDLNRPFVAGLTALL